MKTLTLAALSAVLLATTAPVMAQTGSGMQYPTTGSRVGAAIRRHEQPVQADGGSPGYQANTYVRRPSSRTPTDVGNMAFPDPSNTPAGSLPPVPVGR